MELAEPTLRISLDVTVIGAGIAGLTAAVALRHAGHNVKIFEKSRFAAETGAALLISPNGAKVLTSLGFDFNRAKAREARIWETVKGSSLERISCVDFSDAVERYGEPLRSIHRVDLHNELLRLALESDDAPVTLNLSSTVSKVDQNAGSVELADGTLHFADLIVAGDGLHSVARDAVLGRPSDAIATGMSAFRFLLSTDAMRKDPSAAKLLESKAPGCTIIVDTNDNVNERHMVWYDCRSGEVQNFVGIHPTRSSVDETAKQSMYEEFKHFKPEILHAIELAEDVKCWPLHSHKPLSKLIHGRVALIGDAAHPMLPYGGQGSNQAIEDAGALGQLLQNIDNHASLQGRLQIYERLRYQRASMVQTMSSVRVGREMEVHQELLKYAGPGEKIPSSFSERLEHHFSYDVLAACRGVISKA